MGASSGGKHLASGGLTGVSACTGHSGAAGSGKRPPTYLASAFTPIHAFALLVYPWVLPAGWVIHHRTLPTHFFLFSQSSIAHHQLLHLSSPASSTNTSTSLQRTCLYLGISIPSDHQIDQKASGKRALLTVSVRALLRIDSEIALLLAPTAPATGSRRIN